MFKKTNQEEFDPFIDFLSCVASRGHWEEQWPSININPDLIEHSEAIVNDKGGISIYGKVEINVFRNGAVNVYIAIELERHKSGIWLITRFELICPDQDTNLLTEVKFLKHYGKRPARFEDLKIDDLSKLWTLSTAENLKAYLTKYDELAKFYGCVPLFNI